MPKRERSKKKSDLDADRKKVKVFEGVSIPTVSEEERSEFLVNQKGSGSDLSAANDDPKKHDPENDIAIATRTRSRAHHQDTHDDNHIDIAAKKPTGPLAADRPKRHTPADDHNDKPHVSALAARRAKAKEDKAKLQQDPVAASQEEQANEQETSVVGSDETGHSQPSEKPKSALAARRARRLAKQTMTTENNEHPIDTMDVDNATTPATAVEGPDNSMDPEDPPATPYATPVFSDQEDSPLATPAPAKAPAKKAANKYLDPRSVSTFSPESAFTFEHDDETYLCIGLKKHERLVFVGQALIAPLFGTIDIMGALLSSEESMPSKWTDRLEPLVEFYPVFSSRATALTCVQSVPFQPSCTSSTLVDEYFLNVKGKLGPLQDDWAKYQSIIVVRSMHWNGVAKLEHCLPTMKDLFCVRSKEFHAANQGDFYDVIPGFQPIVTPTLEARCIQIEPSWEQGIGRLFDNELVRTTPPVSFVCGTKNMGKSTFARYLVNQLLNRHRRVAYLETDVGQSEFTPNGIVALHILDTPILGPPFTHPHHVARRAHFVGSTSSGRDPDHYMTCVQQLVEVWRQESDEWLAVAANENDSTSQQLLPLVVNTPGWTKGLGYDLLLGMMEHVAPSHVFAFSAPSLDHKFHEGRQLPPDFADHVRRMGIPQLLYLQTANLANHDTSQLAGRAAHRVPAPTTWMDRYQASDLRQLMTMSWIYMDPTAFGVPATAWWRPCSTLVERVPWKIDWTHLQGIWILFDDVPLSQLLYALNGSLVALIGQVTSDATSNDDDRTALTKKLPAYHSSMKSVPPDPYQTECLGLGLIRSIDREKRQLYLVTSLPLDRLRRVTRIVKGDLELALPMMLDHRSLNLKGVAGVSWRNVPYISLESIDGIGAGKVRARRNLMRRSQQH